MRSKAVDEGTIVFVEELRDAATRCLADDLGDMAASMRAVERPTRTGPFAEAIEDHDQNVRIDLLNELQRLFSGHGERSWTTAELVEFLDNYGA